MDNDNQEQAQAAAAGTPATKPARVRVRILRNRTYAEGGYHRIGARVNLEEGLARRLAEQETPACVILGPVS